MTHPRRMDLIHILSILRDKHLGADQAWLGVTGDRLAVKQSQIWDPHAQA